MVDGEWSEPRQLAHVRGLIGRVGVPPELQAVIYDQGLEIHVIGYDTEDEIHARGEERAASASSALGREPMRLRCEGHLAHGQMVASAAVTGG